MGTEVNNVTNPVSDYANKVREEEEQKRIAYEASMKQQEETENIFKKAESAYKYAKMNYENGKNVGNLNSLKSAYNSALANRISSENNSDILRSSYQDCIFFSAKINSQESIANAILA